MRTPACLALALWAASPLVAQTYGVAVTPDSQTVASKTTFTTGWTQVFRVTNEGTGTQTFQFTCAGDPNVTCTGLSQTSATIAGNSFLNVTATYSVASQGTGSLGFAATGPQSTDQGVIFVPVVPGAGMPRVDFAPYLEAKQDLSRCAASCFAASYAQGTVPFYSLDAARNVTLVYQGDRLAPKPFVAVDVFPDTTFGTWPTEYQLQVKLNTNLVTFVNGDQTLRFNGTTGSTKYRIAGQFVDTMFTDGQVIPMEILVSAKISGVLYTNRYLTQYLSVTTRKSPIARGWSVAGVQKAFVATGVGVLVTEGDGSATYFHYSPVSKRYDAPAGDFSRLDSVAGAWVRAYADSTKVKFNSSGQMASVTSRFGDSTWVTYVSGKMGTIKDHLGNTITFAFGPNGLNTITDPTSRVTTFSIAATDSTLTWIQDPDNLKTSFGYDANKRLVKITARNNDSTIVGYDPSSWKVATITAPPIPVFGSPTPASPVTTLAAWQKLGVPYTTTAVTPFAPVRADTAFARVTEPGGTLLRFTVNRWGSPVRTKLPATVDGSVDSTMVAYTTAGLPTRVVRPGYGMSDFDTLAYNATGLVTYAKPAQATATKVTWGAYAQPLTVATQSQDSVTYFRSSLGKVDSVRVGTGTVARYVSYDAYGRPKEMRRPGADTTRWTYDSTGTVRNLAKVTLSGGRTTTYRYDTRGRTVFAGSSAPTDSFDYGIMNQMTASRKRTALTTVISTSYQYDNLFNVTQVTDPKGQMFRFTYNALGWLIQQQDSLVRRDTLQYSLDGDLRRITDRRGLNVDYTYDNHHRVTTRVGSTTVTYGYPFNGTRIVGATSVATDTVFLNVRGQPDQAVTWMAGQRYTRHYAYTVAGLLDSIYVDTNAVKLLRRHYSWDLTKGLLANINLQGSLTTITRDAGLQDSVITLAGSAGTIGRTFGSLHAPVKITASQQPPAERWVGFDVRGRVTEHLTQGGKAGRFFTYDSLGRYQKGEDSVTTGTPPPGCPDLVNGSLLCNNGLVWTDSVGTLTADTLDLVGNRLSKGGTYTAGTNRLTAFNGCTYALNAAGSDSVRTCGATVTTFGWNAEGQLTSLGVTGKDPVTFAYDAFGRLVRKDSAAVHVGYFLWDGEQLLAEVGGTGTTVKAEYSYYPGLDRPHALIIGGTKQYVYADGLGNVIRLGSEAGGLSRTFTYDDWGHLTGTVDGAGLGSKDRTRWKGALWFGEETELYYLRNRWYDPGTGRFISADPVGLAGGINPFTFAGDDPVNGSDPQGLISIPSCGKGETLWATWVETPLAGGGVSREYIRFFCVGAPPGGRTGDLSRLGKAMIAMPACPGAVDSDRERDADITIGGAPMGFTAITFAGTIAIDPFRFANLRDLSRAGLLEHEMYHVGLERTLGILGHLWGYLGSAIRNGLSHDDIPEEMRGNAIQVSFLRAHNGGGNGAGVCEVGR